MIQLTYDSAYDPYHTAFRILRLCLYSVDCSIKVPKLRILDFYLNFPFLLQKFVNPDEPSYSLPRGGRGYLKKINFEAIPRPYSDLPDSRIIFQQMDVIQNAAIQTMCLRGMVDKNIFADGYVRIVPDKIPPNLKRALTERNQEQKELIEFLMGFMAQMTLDGSKGLKDRTRLLEHRYDAI